VNITLVLQAARFIASEHQEHCHCRNSCKTQNISWQWSHKTCL